MKKSELIERIKELEQREILLEYIVQKFYEFTEVVQKHPASNMILEREAFEMTMYLYNEAEIRTNIEDLVTVEVEYE